LIFYSGNWCPGCNLSLNALEEVRPLIEARGASLVAISSQTIEENKNVGFVCRAARGIPRGGITARDDRQ
jgi:peroxiredoxin